MFGDIIGADIVKAAPRVDQARREVTAYAAVFNNVDRQGERCIPGCFAKTISERLKEGQIKLFRNHQTHIGVVREAEEDAFGLLTVSYVSKTPDGDAALEQLLDGSLSRYSFRGTVMRGDSATIPADEMPGMMPGMMPGKSVDVFDLKEISLKEVGPCDLDPANPLARVVSVKSLDFEALDALRELPHLIHSFTFGGGRKLSAEESRVVKSLLRLHGEIGDRRDVLEALLQAPDMTTPRDAAPVEKSTRAGANGTPDLEISEALRTLARNRGRLL